MRQVAVGLAIGVGVGAGGAYVYLAAKQPTYERGAAETIWPQADPIRDKAAAEFGAPISDAVRVFDGFAAAYDFRTRNPKWVLEHVTAEGLNGDATRNKSEFFEDPGVDERFRAKLSDFRDSGYDRGHMAPAADLKVSQKAMDESFNLVNISPQIGPGFNRDYWSRFERYIRSLVQKSEGGVYIVTGPLWLPRQDANGDWAMLHPMIGRPPSLVAVPTHYFKVILADARNSTRRDVPKGVHVGAFVMPNAPIDDRIPLSAFAVPLTPLEEVAGTQFFPSYLTTSRRSALDAASSEWRSHGVAQLKPFERVSLGHGMAALPAPTTAAVASLPVPPTQDPPSLPKTQMAGGVGHVCELDACRLPGVWRGPKNNGNINGGGGANSPAGKAPRRGRH